MNCQFRITIFPSDKELLRKVNLKKVEVGKVNLSHSRLVELILLADQAKPFYLWVEKEFRKVVKSRKRLNEILLNCSKAHLTTALKNCYGAKVGVPQLFDGVGKSYPHKKACYYFFSWMLRDAPQQRLKPMITIISRKMKISGTDAEIKAIASLAIAYRKEIGNFHWEAIREIVIDRLEGSRRSLKGHATEAVVRASLAKAIQCYFRKNQDYGKYLRADLASKQVKVGNDTYDVCVELIDFNGKLINRILVPVKSRETQGGGHPGIFTRDIQQANLNARKHSPNSYMIAFVVAENWTSKHTKEITGFTDLAIILKMSPNDFLVLNPTNQKKLNAFVKKVLDNKLKAKRQ